MGDTREQGSPTFVVGALILPYHTTILRGSPGLTHIFINTAVSG